MKIKVILFFLFLLINLSCEYDLEAQIINTFAGNGIPGYTGDGGAAISAEIHNPYGVAVDGSGNVYIADQNNNRIRKVNASGIISTIAGNGTAGYSGDGGGCNIGDFKLSYRRSC